MAKIVILSIPAYGHINPVLPIVAELTRRGHDVVVYNEAVFEELIRATGAGFVAYPPALRLEDLARVLADGNLVATLDLFMTATGPLLDFCVERLPAEHLDVLVFDGTCMWGQMAAKRLGLKSVSTSPFFVFELMRHLTGRAEFWGHARTFLPGLPRLLWNIIRLMRFGPGNFPLQWPPFPMRGDLTLLLTSAALHPKSPLFDDPSFVFVGPAIDPSTRLEQFDFAQLNDRPLIYISLGTLHFSNDHFFQLCMETFADYPAQFLLSAGRGSDIKRFRNVPANFIVADSVPQLAVLERASLFITHGGLNSLHESLWFGVPMVVVPQQFEQLRNALTAARGGAAIVLDDECYRRQVTGPALRAAVEKVLGDPLIRTAARALGASLHDAGGFKEAASLIETIAVPTSRIQ